MHMLDDRKKSYFLPKPPRRDLLTWSSRSTDEQKHSGRVYSVTCQRIAEEFAATYYPTAHAQLVEAAYNNLLEHCEAVREYESFREKLQDYIDGASTAINPYPGSSPSYSTSDYDALQSDWLNVQTDMQAVWHVVTHLHDWWQSDDESAGQSDPHSEKAGRSSNEAGRAEPIGTRSRDYTSGS